MWLSNGRAQSPLAVNGSSGTALAAKMRALHAPRQFLFVLVACSLTCLITSQLLRPAHLNGHFQSGAAFYLHDFATLFAMAPVQAVASFVLMLASAALCFIPTDSSSVSLIDFHCYKPPESLKISKQEMVDECRKAKVFTEENVSFMEKVLAVSGLGERTAFSKGILRLRQGMTKAKSYDECLEESDTVIMDCVENVLQKTNITADQVDIVVVSCSCFAPTPSMAARIVNRFKMRQDVLTYNLSGMGCSSSLICVDMVKHLLQAMPNKLALVINHENITSCFYIGDEKSYLLCNCLFRLGGAAALMSNRPVDRACAKYDLKHTVRVHTGSDDDAFGCMGVSEDSASKLGVFLRRNVVAVAGQAIAQNLRQMGPKVLPYMEQAKVVANLSYIPRFTTAFEHFLIHTGGRAVLDELEKKLQLDEKLMVPSRDVMSRFGNLSAASTWYILSHIEQYGNMRKGDRIFQLGFGGGFKANSAAWVARRNIKQSHSCWED